MAVVERVEELSELKHMLCQIRWLGRRDALFDDRRRFRRCKPKFPDFVPRRPIERGRNVLRGEFCGHMLQERISVCARFTEDASGSYRGILRVRTSFAKEAERVLEVEGYDGLFGVLQHEVPQRADRDLRTDPKSLRFAQLRMSRIDFLLCGRNQLIKQIVCLNSESFPSAHADERARLFLFCQVVAELCRAAWRQHHHPVGKMCEMVGSFCVT